MRRASTWLTAVAAFVVVLVASAADAHPTASSVAYVDFTVDGARVEQDIPIEELERALHLQLMQADETAESAVARHDALLRSYASQHLRAISSGSQVAWRVQVASLVGYSASDGPRATFRFVLTAPAGEASKSVDLHDDIVAHEVVSHYTMIYVRSDWAAGVAPGEPTLAGTVHAGHDGVLVTRHGSFWGGLWSVVALGLEHITSGTDHLMFLLALVLVAPVTAAGRRWNGRASTRETLLGLARVVSAFTVGHSVTLALGALGFLALPSRLIEAGIALSILVTALHAIRPIFARREALVAAGFGLIHGLAFASTLADRNLGTAQFAWTLFGFNSGIELGQLGLLVLVVPWLLLLARTGAYDACRVTGGAIAAIFAGGWLIERATARPNPTALPLAWLEQHSIYLLIALAAGAVLANLARPTSSRKATTSACG